MNCPKCNMPQACGCDSCAKRPVWEDCVRQVWNRTSEPDVTSACGACGFTTTLEDWLEIEVQQMKAAGNWPTKAQLLTSE